MKVTHTETTFSMTGRYWSGTYPISELPKWLRFYHGSALIFQNQERHMMTVLRNWNS